MELVLNLTWLTVGLAMFGIWGWKAAHRRTRRGPKTLMFEAFILLFLGVLLFPVFSMDDDIVGDLFWAPEDRTMSFLAGAPTAHTHIGHVLCHLLLRLITILVFCACFCEERGFRVAFTGITRKRFHAFCPNARFLRAPPAVCIS
jgi:membrane protease YdiL (CAAX protease family)